MDCNSCPAHRQLPGTHHVSCHHRLVEPVWNTALGKFLGAFGGIPMVPAVEILGVDLPVVGLDPHGVRNGWVNWPFNYDQIWVQYCILKTVEAYLALLEPVSDALSALVAVEDLDESKN